MARRWIEVKNVAAPSVKRLRDGKSDGAKSHDANGKAIEAGEIFSEHADAKRGVAARSDFGIAPGETAQQSHGSRHRVFRKSNVAAAGNIGDGNAETLHGVQIEAIEASTGHLHKLDAGAFKERARKFRAHCGDYEYACLLHQIGNVGIVRRTIGDAKSGWRQRIGALEIRFRAQAEYVEGRGRGVHCLGGVPATGSSVPLVMSATGKKHKSKSGSVPVLRVTCFSPAGTSRASPGFSGYSPLSANVVPCPAST